MKFIMNIFIYSNILLLFNIFSCSSKDVEINNKTSNNLVVSTITELNNKIKSAHPGDTIILKNGIYRDAKLVLHARGEKDKPIIVQAENPGKVFIEGSSSMRIGGQYVEIHGLTFREGYGRNVWEFRSKTGMLANNCRITNCIIDGYNNPDDKEEERWVLLYGKNNRIDHCTFIGKENEGVLMAVILEETKGDNESRMLNSDNYHKIDHNYFGKRPKLKYVNNGGEIIRIGDSFTSQLSSKTIVENNVFEQCDGEVEIISVKSCDNILRNNFFIECSGALVLRHGHRNLIQNNVFIGNGKQNTAGVRVINSGHVIKNNHFVKLKGNGSYSAFSIMNALEDPKANEYHIVKDVLIEDNVFIECENITFNLRHSDPVRAVVQIVHPQNVKFQGNIFFNKKQQLNFEFLDGEKGIEGFIFRDNVINTNVINNLEGFSINEEMNEPATSKITFQYGVNYKI